ncbi:MAG: acetate--CoA ligase family protein [Actinobacteria bacterium]|nr:acetate--CoA ligase family protein [Actinomycetota bacterium]MCB9388765.1 acetate--CoA ligase family protein [Acidimicrobiia bacterium]
MHTWSEADARDLLTAAGVAVVSATKAPIRCSDIDDIGPILDRVLSEPGPWALKVSSANVAHKTERGLVRLGLTDADQVTLAAAELAGLISADDGDCELLLSPLLDNVRELIVGVTRDDTYGTVVMLGTGGVAAELVGDVVFRQAPITRFDAQEMMDDLALNAVLDEFRGRPAVDRQALGTLLIALSDLMTQRDDLQSIECNPVLIDGGTPVAVDALVVAI